VEVIGTKTLEYDIEQMQNRRAAAGKRRLRIIYVRQYSNSKEDRIRALTSYYERGDAHHIEKAPGIALLEGELTRFPRAKNDDVSDAWSGILRVGRKPRRVETDPEAIQKRKRYTRMLNKPRSPMTGY